MCVGHGPPAAAGTMRRCFRVRGKLARPGGSAAPSSPAAHQNVWPNAWAIFGAMIAGIPGRTCAAPIPAFPEVPRSDASAEARTAERLPATM